jgi:hypothetical protein
MIYIHILDFTAAIRFGWFHNDLYQLLLNLDNMMPAEMVFVSPDR